MELPYLMQVPCRDELWLVVDGETRILITPEIYDLLASNGADLPPAYGIDKLKAENAELRERVSELDELLPENGRWFSAETVEACVAENKKLRELLQRLLTEYRYMRVRPRAMYLQHEGRMRAIEEEMRELGIEVGE